MENGGAAAQRRRKALVQLLVVQGATVARRAVRLQAGVATKTRVYHEILLKAE